MPSAKSGTACTLISPIAPAAAHEADNADPGEVSAIKADQKQTQTGKYGTVPVQAYKPPSASSDGSSGSAQTDPPKQWVEIQMLDEEGKPVAGEPYQIKLPDGTVDSGTTDGSGVARVEGIDPGSCQITFPNRDQEAWQPT